MKSENSWLGIQYSYPENTWNLIAGDFPDMCLEKKWIWWFSSNTFCIVCSAATIVFKQWYQWVKGDN